MSSLCTLYNQIQIQLDNEAKWAHHNNYLQSLSANNAPSIIEPVFSEIFDQMKKYLMPLILSIQRQQIFGVLLYYSNLISIEFINNIPDDEIDSDIGFFKDQLDKPQATLSYLIDRIQLADIVEIWELFGLTREYKYYAILFIDGSHLCTCLSIINHGLGFGKIKKALNIVLDFDCMDEFISMIDTFIAYKKNSIEETNQENINMDIADPIVCKYRGRLATKKINRTNNSALNLPDPNLYKESTQHLDNTPALRVSFQSLNINESNNTNKSFSTDSLANSSDIKCKYVCQMCSKPGHNARSYNKS
ncbi:4796_t:CDS:2, partial [Gigaspora rosea]